VTDAAAAKSVLRAEARARRLGLAEDVRRAASQAIRVHIIASPQFDAADLVLTYVPVRSEADVLGVASAALAAGKRAAIPRTAAGQLSFDELDPDDLGEVNWRDGAFGIPVAAQERPVVPTPRTLVLVPLVAFDCTGHRLGSGKGFYDRYLDGFPGVAMGVAFAVQQVPSVPTEPHDRRLHHVVTEAGLGVTAEQGAAS
jgi:5-formyltetrahydrofolate cyclo-ligase